MEGYVRPWLSHSNSLGNDAEKGAAGRRASDRKFIVIGGIDFFDSAVAAQPLYRLRQEDWSIWLDAICDFCEDDKRDCYAENAFNGVSDRCVVYALDVKDNGH